MPCQARCARATIFQPWCARRRWSSPWRSGSRVVPRCSRRRRAVSRPTVRSRNAAAERRRATSDRRRSEDQRRTPSRRASKPAAPAATRRRPATPRNPARRAAARTKRSPRAACTRSPAWRATRPTASARASSAATSSRSTGSRSPALGGYYASDALSSTYSYGGARRVLPVGGLRPRGAGHADADQVPARGAVQRVRSASSTSRPAPPCQADRVAAVVADPRQVQVHRGDHHPRRHLRAGGRRPDVPRIGAGADLGGGPRPQAVLLALRHASGWRCATS